MKGFFRKYRILIQTVLAMFAVLTAGISTMAWFQVNSLSARQGSFTNDSTSTTLSVDEVTGYRFERDHINSSTIDYTNGNGSAAAVNVKGDDTDNNIQEGETTELDIPEEGMGFYCLNSYNSYKKSAGIKMTGLSGNSKAKLDEYQVAAGESVKFIQHASDGNGSSVDYDWVIQGIYSYDGTTQGLINGGTISYTSALITFSSAGTFYMVINTDGRIELRRVNENGPTRPSRASGPTKKNASGPTPENYTVYMLQHGDTEVSGVRYALRPDGGTYNGNWYDFSESNYKFNNLKIYKATVPGSFTDYYIERDNKNRTSGNYEHWGTSGKYTFSSSANYLTNNGNYMQYNTSSFASVLYDGWILIGKSGSGSSTFGTGNFTIGDAHRFAAPQNTTLNEGQISTFSFKTGDTFKVSKLVGGNVDWSNNDHGYSKLDVYVGNSPNTTLKDRYFDGSNNSNIEVLQDCTVAIYWTKESRININFGASRTVSIYARKIGYNQSDYSAGTTHGTAAATYTAYSGETVSSSTLSELSLTLPDYYSQVGTSFYTTTACSTAFSSATITSDLTLYIKAKENTIAFSVKDYYMPKCNGSNGDGPTTKSISIGAIAAASKNAAGVYSLWTDAGGGISTGATYASTYSYGYDDIYTDPANQTKFTTTGVSNGATYYVVYKPTEFTFSRRIEFWDEAGQNKISSDIKQDISLTNLGINSITAFARTSPYAQGIYSDSKTTYGYEFSSWYVSYNNGSTWTQVTNGLKPTAPQGNITPILAARFTACETETLYIDISGPVTGTNWTNWTRNMTLKVYAFYFDIDAGGTTNKIENGNSVNNDFGQSCEHIFQFHYKIDLPTRCDFVVNCNQQDGDNRTEDITFGDGLNDSHNMIILSSSSGGTYNNVQYTWGDYNSAWDPSSVVSNDGDDFFIHIYDSDGLLFTESEKTIKMNTGAAAGHMNSDQAYILQLPLTANTQFAITRLASGAKDRVNYIYGHESIGSDSGGTTFDYAYEEQGDQIGSSSNFAKMLSVDSKSMASISGMHLFKIKNSGVYDIFINQDGNGANQNKVFFEQCELRLNYYSGSSWSHADMYLGDGENYFSILEHGQQLNENDLAYVSVKSNRVVNNYGWADLVAADQTKGYAVNSGQLIPEESSKYSIKIKKSARYAVYVKIVDSALKITFSDMPDKGEGYYICQNDASYYSFGKAVKMRQIALPGNNSSDYYYQYCAYSASAGETIKLVYYANYQRKEVTSVTGTGVSINGTSHVITISTAGIYDIFIKKDLTSAVFTKRSSVDNFLSLNSYSGMSNQAAIQNQNTSIVIKFKVSWTAPASGRTIKLRLIGENVNKLGVAKTALLGNEVSDPYNTIRTDYYAGLARYNGDVSIGTTSTASGNAYFYAIVDYFAGQSITSATSFKMAVILS